MPGRCLIAAIALCLAPPAFADWTERYFGVGSAPEEGAACGLPTPK